MNDINLFPAMGSQGHFKNRKLEISIAHTNSFKSSRMHSPLGEGAIHMYMLSKK
jgi:hypothetical protein